MFRSDFANIHKRRIDIDINWLRRPASPMFFQHRLLRSPCHFRLSQFFGFTTIYEVAS